MVQIILLCIVFSVFAISFARGASETASSNSNECILPAHPEHGKWSLGASSDFLPQDKVGNGSVIGIRCDKRYKLIGSSVITCENGKWNLPIGQCLELCPPIIEKSSTIVTCTTNGINSDCRTPTNSTIATIKCAPYYENVELNKNPFRICRHGRWDREIIFCSPVCGVKPKPSVEFRKSYYPWNIAIYRVKDNTKVFRCVGTLITENVILTAAVCITNNSSAADAPNTLLLAAGKSVDDYLDSEDTESQYSSVKDLFIPDNYRDADGHFVAELAIVIAGTAFNMTRRVQPACFDWTNKYQKQFNFPSNSSKAAGSLNAQQNPLQRVYVNVPLVDSVQCLRLLIPNNCSGISYQYSFFRAIFDKYCSGYINADEKPRNSLDDGVGLISKNIIDEKHYVIGVMASSATGYDCTDKIFYWVLFTKLFKYADFLSEKANLYAPINTVLTQTSCGVKSVQAQTLIVNGNVTVKGDYPWQVALYKISDSNKSLICGGTLINQRVILTAAHCVTEPEGKKFPKEQYVVAVGKYYRDFNDPRDKNTQYSALSDIILSSEYQGYLQNFLADIAILICETSLELSRYVLPICVDWEAKYENQFLQPNVTGYVAGWGYTQENQSPSDELKDLEVPYIEPTQCKRVLPDDYEIYLTSDKFCSGFLNQGKGVCNGDSGGGLVFKNKNDYKFYLAGIVSISPQTPSGGCDSQQYTLYTRVSKYIVGFVSEQVKIYWA